MGKKDFANIARNLRVDGGIWFSDKDREISYPKDGNDEDFELESDSFWFDHRNDCIIETVKNFPPDGCIFDVGGGNGFVSAGLEDCGFETVLVEPGIRGILNARNRGIKNLICSTFGNARFKECSLPAVGLFDVLEHIENDREFLTELRSCLVRNGRLYITVPSFDFLRSHTDDYAGHYRRYSLADLTELLEEAGFSVEYSTYVFSVLPVFTLFFRVLPYRLFSRRNSLEGCKKEHKRFTGFFGRVIDKIWGRELRCIKNKKKIGFGGSCLIVAVAVKHKP